MQVRYRPFTGIFELISMIALRVCEAFISSSASADSNTPRPFVYISAEDIFRPVIPARYIETKREAEQDIESMMVKNPSYRGVYMRPSTCFSCEEMHVMYLSNKVWYTTHTIVH